LAQVKTNRGLFLLKKRNKIKFSKNYLRGTHTNIANPKKKMPQNPTTYKLLSNHPLTFEQSPPKANSFLLPKKDYYKMKEILDF
jgi:hypothetical protein